MRVQVVVLAIEGMAQWDKINILKRGYGAKHEYKWRHFEVGKGEQSNEGWYLTDNKWNIEYNQNRDFIDSVRSLFWRHESSSHPKIQAWVKRENLAIPFKNAQENSEFTHEMVKILKRVAQESQGEYKMSESYDDTLFKNSNPNYGFRKAKDAMKVAELIADWQDRWEGWGIVNHVDFAPLQPEPEPPIAEVVGFEGLGSLFG